MSGPSGGGGGGAGGQVREYQLTLYADPSDQFGFGLRVVAASAAGATVQQQQQQGGQGVTCAR